MRKVDEHHAKAAKIQSLRILYGSPSWSSLHILMARFQIGFITNVFG